MYELNDQRVKHNEKSKSLATGGTILQSDIIKDQCKGKMQRNHSIKNQWQGVGQFMTTWQHICTNSKATHPLACTQ